MKSKIGYPGLSKTGGQDGSKGKDTGMEWNISTGAITFEGRISMPEALHNQVISLFHNNPESGHCRALWTAEHVSRDFYSLELDTTVQKYVARCKVCHRITAPRHTRYAANLPLPPLYNPRHIVTMDFVTDRWESTKWRYTRILVIVNWFTKIAIYLHYREDINLPEFPRMFFRHVCFSSMYVFRARMFLEHVCFLRTYVFRAHMFLEHVCFLSKYVFWARMFFEHMIWKHGIRNTIVTNRGTQFTSRFWTWVCSHMSIDQQLPTTFHRQTACQTQRQNQTLV